MCVGNSNYNAKGNKRSGPMKSSSHLFKDLVQNLQLMIWAKYLALDPYAIEV